MAGLTVCRLHRFNCSLWPDKLTSYRLHSLASLGSLQALPFPLGFGFVVRAVLTVRRPGPPNEARSWLGGFHQEC